METGRLAGGVLNIHDHDHLQSQRIRICRQDSTLLQACVEDALCISFP